MIVSPQLSCHNRLKSLNSFSVSLLDLSQFDDSYVRDLQRQLAESGRKLWVLDVTSDLGVPTFVAVTHWMQNGRENIEFGSGAHFDTKIALLRALTELNQFLSLGLMGGARLRAARQPSRPGLPRPRSDSSGH